MCTHLQKRGSVYYFRRVIPVDLQAHFKRKQWMWSLETKDLTEGKRLARQAGIQTDSEIEVALAAVAEGQCKPPAQHYRPLTEWDIEQAEFNVRQGIEWDDARESREEGKALLEKRLNRPSDELLNETLFHGLDHARAAIREWLEDYNTGRPHSSLAYATPAAFAAELEKQGAA